MQKTYERLLTHFSVSEISLMLASNLEIYVQEFDHFLNKKHAPSKVRLASADTTAPQEEDTSSSQ